MQMQHSREDFVEFASLSDLLTEMPPMAETFSSPLSSPASRRFQTRGPLFADSVKRKRAKKMNKHKYKKRLKEQRRQSRKTTAQ